MYAAAGGASLAGRKARQHGRQPAPGSPGASSPPHPAPSGVRAYSCQHWESRLAAPPRPHSAAPSDLAEVDTSGTKLASMQAALMLRSKSRERRKQRLKRGIKHDLPSNVATRGIAPFPRYPPASWCAAGRAAWQEAAALSVGAGGVGAGGAARRCSVLGDHPGARKDQKTKWHRNNRVRDASYGSSSESDGEPEGSTGEPWGLARLLYAGLGTLAVGLVVYFVGTGDKGFKTPALRLVGPSLCVAGLACCLLRIMFCIFAKPCCRRRTNYKENRRLSSCGEGEEMPLAGRGGTSRGPAQCSPARRLDTSSCDVSSLSSGEEDERLRRYRIASGRPPSLTQATSSHSTVPQSSGQQSMPSSSQQTPGETQKQLAVASDHSTTMYSNVPSTSAGVRSPLAGSAPSPTLPGSLGAVGALSVAGPRRAPPRNVSFASGPDGELVLSPAQLRS